jgi:hypothetical protein
MVDCCNLPKFLGQYQNDLARDQFFRFSSPQTALFKALTRRRASTFPRTYTARLFRGGSNLGVATH